MCAGSSGLYVIFDVRCPSLPLNTNVPNGSVMVSMSGPGAGCLLMIVFGMSVLFESVDDDDGGGESTGHEPYGVVGQCCHGSVCCWYGLRTVCTDFNAYSLAHALLQNLRDTPHPLPMSTVCVQFGHFTGVPQCVVSVVHQLVW